MPELRVAVCDDEKCSRREIVDICKSLGKVSSIDEYISGVDILNHYEERENPYDIVILDIIMPGISGIEAARGIRKFDRNVIIIFSTTSKEDAVSGYEVFAFGYLVKPVSRKKLKDLLEYAIQRLEQNEKVITVHFAHKYERIPISDIVFIEKAPESKQIHIQLRDKRMVCSSTLRKIIQSLPSDIFSMISQSIIVNMHFVKRVDKNSRNLYTEYPHPLTIARPRMNDVLNSFLEVTRR